MQGVLVCGGASLPEPKCNWCCIAGYIIRKFNKEHFVDSQPVNYMGYNKHNPYPTYIPHSNYATYPSGNYVGELQWSLLP